jgi:phosphate transport system substrate-binding protein
VQSDRYALGISGARFATGGVKALALAETDGGPYYVPSRETVIARTYPLGRSTYALVDIAPGRSMDPKVREFLTYVLSSEGQADVARDGGYLPLSPAVLAAQRELLK